jgi:ATP-dependent Lon protease
MGVHVPEGAIPKDGPSAGIVMATALASALTKIPIRKDVTMTGEITLRGRVLPVGGVKEKMLAAHRAGIKYMLMPADNLRDLSDIPQNVRRKIEVKLVEHMDEVLELALVKPVGSSADHKKGKKIKESDLNLPAENRETTIRH